MMTEYNVKSKSFNYSSMFQRGAFADLLDDMGRPYSALTLSDIEALVQIVSKLQRIDDRDLNAVSSILRQLDVLLGINTSALGVYYPESNENLFIAITINEELLPTFADYPCPLSGFVSSSTDKGSSTTFFESQDGSLYIYLCIDINSNCLQERQKQLLCFILPYLYSSINRLHSVSKRLAAYGLTERELEVMKWIMEGKDNWSISKILNISERTIKFHNCNIYKKLGVSAKAEMICEYHKLISSLNNNVADNMRRETIDA